MKNTKNHFLIDITSTFFSKPILILFLFLSSCGEKELGVKPDPLVQLFVINFANDYYSNSCQYPSLVLKKGESYKLELKLDEQKWFRFSQEGVTTSPSSVSHHSFFIQKATNTEVSWITSSNCLTSPSYT
ncbi:hypothetical protein JWG41_16190 [Leptospira sp. 201903075]|uniref:hypothetical protein n=1 Tax=Leptospira chreensis TaxID=2810035 RepID=UPI001965B45F|nr:hypothetical protein [Leptospira chreensis]MBM9591989.1 hypothetical protein [Leptospira chreensis]